VSDASDVSDANFKSDVFEKLKECPLVDELVFDTVVTVEARLDTVAAVLLEENRIVSPIKPASITRENID